MKKRTLKVTCAKCGNTIEIKAGVPTYIACHKCGHTAVKFDRDVTRVCQECGGTEKIKSGKVVSAFHQKVKGGPNHLISAYKLPIIRKSSVKKDNGK